MLVEGLRLLAAPARVQLEVLPDFVCQPDEVLLTFSDAFLLAPQLMDAGLMDHAAATALEAIDQFLMTVPEDGSLEPAETLETHEFWETSRQLASQALKALEEERKPPNLRHISWA